MSFSLTNRRRDSRSSFSHTPKENERHMVTFAGLVEEDASDSDGNSLISYLNHDLENTPNEEQKVQNGIASNIDETNVTATNVDDSNNSFSTRGRSFNSLSTRGRSGSKKGRLRKKKENNGPSSREQHKSLRDTGNIECWPADSYSFLAINSPFRNPGYFFFGLSVYIFQILFLIFMMLGQISKNLRSNGEVDNPSSSYFASFTPCNVSFLVRATQITALLSYCVFADSSLKDVVTAVERFPRFDHGTRGEKLWQIAFSCVLRFSQGLLAMICTLLLVVTSTDVIEIILNFAAVNVISGLDEIAFDLAKWGKYGPGLEHEAKRIENTPIPYFIFRKYNHVRYQFTVIPISVLLFLIMGFIIYSQNSYKTWVTRMVRVQFQDSTGLQQYSGCYELSKGEAFDKRKIYNSYNMNHENATIGYCRDRRQWILFKRNSEDSEDNRKNPCETSRENELARSATADTFDISSSYANTWYSAMGTPLDLYFFESEDDYGDLLREDCGSFLNNGICDESFNQLQYQYDGGDCCAYTCNNPDCAGNGTLSAFGVDKSIGTGYPFCRDPDMVPITIHLNSVASSRDESILIDVTDDQVKEYMREKGIDFWEEDPVTPLFIVDCDGINVLSVYVKKEMENQKEMIMIKDGAICQISVSNTTNFEVKWDNDPIWWVDYTVYDGENTSNQIVKGYSGENDSSFFRTIPSCYFTTLQGSINISDAYIADDDSTHATNWLLNDTSRYSRCNNNFLKERFALAALNFAAPIISDDTKDSLWISTEQQCRWENIACDGGSVETLAVRSKDLHGTISTSVGLLTGLRRMDYDNNGLSGTIPTEIGQLTNLKGLDIDNNKLTGTIPTELGLLVEMLELDLDANDLQATIPTEFGYLTNAWEFDLRDNSLTGQIPSEIGFLKNITTLSFQNNKLSGTIPIEIGLLCNLRGLQLTNNSMSGTIPSEINSCSELEEILFNGNNMRGTIPTEIGKLTNLLHIDIDDNKFSGSIPSEIGKIKSLERIRIRNNSFTGSIPSEIGSLTNLREIRFENNNFEGTIPREITLIERLRIITFDKTLSGVIPDNVKTSKLCKICKGNSYELQETGAIVHHENDGEGIMQKYNCSALMKEAMSSIVSRDGCKIVNEKCVDCISETIATRG